MSSYSEYLGRMKQRLPKVQDTRPHQDASQHTTNVKRRAASGVLETWKPATSGNMVLDGPSTRVNSIIKPSHSVQDASTFLDYTAGQAHAQGAMPINAKTPQINPVCYSSTTVPEYNDRLAADPQLSAIQAAKNNYQRGWNTAACCRVCGEPPQLAGGCNCALTTAQRNGLKDKVGTRIHTA